MPGGERSMNRHLGMCQILARGHEDRRLVIENPDRRPIEIGRETRREIRAIVHGRIVFLVYDSAVFRDGAAQRASFEAEIEEEGAEL